MKIKYWDLCGDSPKEPEASYMLKAGMALLFSHTTFL